MAQCRRKESHQERDRSGRSGTHTQFRQERYAVAARLAAVSDSVRRDHGFLCHRLLVAEHHPQRRHCRSFPHRFAGDDSLHCRADHFRERRWHVIVPVLVAAVGFCICAMSENQITPAIFGLSLGAMGVVTAVSMFWALPTAFLGGAGAAAGIALINCTGNLAGFVSPSVIGWLKTQTHSVSSGLFFVAAMLALSAVLVLGFIPAKIVNR